MKQLDKIYEPQKIEDNIYKMWEEGGYFRPEINPEGKPYTIVMPPPNITGQLHIGHAFDGTLQDILIRYKRMQGYSALWLPGEDHASIATEVKVIEHIKETEGLTKQDIGREEFLNRTWNWANFYRERIAKQFRKIGASCDWSREHFTMDQNCSNAVLESFERLYSEGLIYRANRIINWCPSCKTALSDAEVEYEEQTGHLWHIKYPIDGTNDHVVVATTRPETMLGDTAVAVNPNDERYKNIVGKYVNLPLSNRKIPIIADEYVDMEFGTGCVKITPCHDPNDFEVGLRHNLEQIRIMNDDATINENGGVYCGLSREAARDKVLEDLISLGLLQKTETHIHNVGTCYRCSTTVEPLTSLQWFVSMQKLAEPAIDAVRTGDTTFIPDRFKKIYFNWMENIKDWCISRQLWWGHRIPAYYCDECGEVVVSKSKPDSCPKCGHISFHQDEDVLDTWFSSALWPLSTLGWPEKTPDFEKFYPNDVLVTGFDIIFFWVARMIFSGLKYDGRTPFHHVYIHGIIRDSLGRKMSKSLGNGIDPLEVVNQYGADALRFALVTGNAAGNDSRWQPEKIESSRNFANKINNAARFIIMNLEDFEYSDEFDLTELSNIDKWIISRTNEMINEVTINLDKYELGIALEKLYNFIWTEFCDWYIEFSKSKLNGEDGKARYAAQWTLYTVFIDILKLLHPFMPFITEYIYMHICEGTSPLIISKWPVYSESKDFKNEQFEVSEIIEGIRGLRNARVKLNIAPSKKSDLIIVPKNGNEAIYRGNEDIFVKMAGAENVTIMDTYNDIDNVITIITNSAKFFMPLNNLIDKEKELQRLNHEIEKISKDIEMIKTKLSNENFVNKAPEKVVAGEREKLRKAEEKLDETISEISKYQ